MPRSRSYIWPPHPSDAAKVRPEDLDTFEQRGTHVAQRKFGGDAASICWCDGKLDIFSRHGGPFKRYAVPPEPLVECFRTLNTDGSEHWFHGELLHFRAKSAITGEQRVTNTIVLFDLLMAGKYLLNVNQMDRLERLRWVCGFPATPEPGRRALSVASSGEKSGRCQLWLAEVFEKDFAYYFDEFFNYDALGRDKEPEIEGLCLRQKSATLSNPGHSEYDVNWIVRCRKVRDGKYSF